MDDLALKIPPHSEEAEVSLLGAMMLSKEAITSAVEVLRAKDFYSGAHSDIYTAMVSLYNLNMPVDIITVSQELKKFNALEKVGGFTYLSDLCSSVGAVGNAPYYAKIIKEKSTLRELIKTGDDLVSSSYDPASTSESVLERAEQSLFNITQDANKQGLVPIKEVLLQNFSEMQERAKNKTGLTGLTTGFADLDLRLSGLQKSDLILLAARPSMGKTALMVNIASNAALKAKAKVAMFSLEMSKSQLTQRIISSNTHLNLQKIISGDLNSEEWTKVVDILPKLSTLDIEIDDTSGISPIELKAKCRRLKMEKGLDLIVIDYLQLMQMGGRVESRQQEISAISRALKGIAKELEVPVIALSQLSRLPETRADHRPILSDLRESGAIEQDADVVMFLYRDEYYNADTEEPNVGEVIIAKHRNGPTGTVKLVFLPEFTKFVNMKKQ
ncbi:replicative DNA helicase [Clostridiales bacterium KA00134]|nr:replicative DNA helicase [Clostridiales bacterium KA00134]